MFSAFIKYPDGRTSTDASPENLAAALRDPRAMLWLDMMAPSDEDFAILDDVFGFHPLAIEDVIQYNQRPKIESYNHIGDVHKQGYFYLVIHGPDLETFRENLQTKELDVFVSERYLVTCHEQPFKTTNDLIQRAKTDPRLVLDPGIDMLLHNILDHLVDALIPILDYLQDALDELEDQAAVKPTPDVLARIATKKRELLNLRRIIGPQREVLAQLTRGEVPFIRESSRVYFRDVQDHLTRAVETIELYRDLVLGARDIYMSSINNNLNQIMKTLTIISVIALPMTVISSFFGMNFEGMQPWDWIRTHAIGFWLMVAFTVALVGSLMGLFYYKKWL